MTACESCGQLISDDRDFCPNCGAYLRWNEPESDDPPTEVLQDVPEQPLQETPEQPPAAVLEVEAPAPVAQSTPVSVSLKRPDDPGAGAEPPTVQVRAGGSAQLVGMVFNQSGIVDRYDLRIDGLHPSWWTVSPPTVDLVPFGADDGTPEQRVEVSLHPPRSPDAEARPWEIALVARSHSRGTDAEGRGTLTIDPYEQLECRVRPQILHDQRSGRFAVPTRNLGNAPAHVHFEGEDDEGALEFEFVPPSLTLGPGREGLSELKITARTPVRDAPRQRRLTIAAQGTRERAESHATFVQEPKVVRSHRFAWRIGLTLLAAFLLILGAFLKWRGVDKGICTSGDNLCLSYDHYLALAPGHTTPAVPDVGSLQGPFATATSIGILAAFFGLLVLAGARRGTLTWIAGCLAVLLAIAMFVTIWPVGIGVWFVLIGGIAAIAAGALSRSG